MDSEGLWHCLDALKEAGAYVRPFKTRYNVEFHLRVNIGHFGSRVLAIHRPSECALLRPTSPEAIYHYHQDHNGSFVR